MIKKVMTFGTFDKFHKGHIYYLTEAKKLGSQLITVIARDETVFKIKGRQPHENETTRAGKVQNSRIADEVLLGSLTDPYESVLKYKPDLLCFGYDQQSFNTEKLEIFLQENDLHPEIIRLEAFEPEKWKSSKL